MLQTRVDKKYYNITLALAGVFQASSLVNQLATQGKYDEIAFDSSIQSIYKLDAADVPSIFGNVENLKAGLKELISAFSGKKTANPQINRYGLSLILLQHKLAQNKEMLNEIRRRLEQIQSQIAYFSPTHDNVLANAADIYISTLSNFRFRIQIMGKPQILQYQTNMNKMRALFLAGIRSAVLWRQMGGRRWQLFFARKKIALMATNILNGLL